MIMEPGWLQSMNSEQATAFPGGRRAAEQRLSALDPARYAATRNHLDGAVTRLSPYIRHGVLTLAEVRNAVFAGLQERGYDTPERQAEGQRIAGKLINELGWRDYWQRLWRQLGDGIWHDLEPLKTGHPSTSYSAGLPADVSEARTGLACIDSFSRQLQEIGWLHNHARMWLASYLVHWRRVRWQAGARWFLQHLLDGDPASNNLSWQWVASSFSSKPYFFNRANLERFSSGRYCSGCPLADRRGQGGCPFDASYETLQAQLFQPLNPRVEAPAPPPATRGGPLLALPSTAGPPPLRPLVWVHGEALGPANPALLAHPHAPALFVFDIELITGRTAITGGPATGHDRPVPLGPGRLRFLRECLSELPVEVRQGDVAAELLAVASSLGADGIVTSRGVDPRFAAIASHIAQALPLRILEPEPFVALPFDGNGAPDLRRFSRYWRKVEPLVWQSLTEAMPIEPVLIEST